MTKSSLAAILFIQIILTGGCSMSSTAGSNDINGVFDRMEQALRNKDENAFKAEWHPEGYGKNLVGGSGLSGSSVFRQGSREGWYMKADFSKLSKMEDVSIVPCGIWSWEKNKSMDEVTAAVVGHGGKLVVLGAGEDIEQVRALAKRFLSKAPLAPSKK